MARPEITHRPELLAIWRELARRVGKGDRPARLTLRDLSAAEQSAIADLLGRDRLPGPDFRLAVDALCASVGAGGLDELTSIAESIVGPIIDRPGRRAADLARREELWEELAAGLADLDWVEAEGLGRYMGSLRATGVGSADIDRRRALHGQMLAVLRCLPADGLSLAVLAAQTLGDPHGLDAVQPLSRLVTQAVAAFCGVAAPADTEAQRAVWERVGVTTDQVSSAVLVLGLSVRGTHGLAGQLNSAAAADEPVVLTLRQLRRWPLPALASSEVALVVENPSVVEAAADRNEREVRRLICSNGHPSVAVRVLLRQLAPGGASLRQHADFDPSGITITTLLQRQAGTTPWQMTAAAYCDALSTTPTTGFAMQGEVPPTPWDPELQHVMQQHRRVISEEHLLATLLT